MQHQHWQLETNTNPLQIVIQIFPYPDSKVHWNNTVAPVHRVPVSLSSTPPPAYPCHYQQTYYLSYPYTPARMHPVHPRPSHH
ncbi:hypothetical protein GYMLUDRAFT_669905 [Collybiopsis luxurians FD-317 M1]|uniref:Uncharacterized protein n=1 Tax=Collybiopsis luxurians FD-317 M1 TaxID=944289 RepID=A0A0D0CUM5_9AGAR|nr:hypothetical protein GYMLUDRAFT_669905 [Collybiopsis luxurians FD-317 M1]